MPRRKRFGGDDVAIGAGDATAAAANADPEGRPFSGAARDEADGERTLWWVLGVITLAALVLPKLVR